MSERVSLCHKLLLTNGASAFLSWHDYNGCFSKRHIMNYYYSRKEFLRRLGLSFFAAPGLGILAAADTFAPGTKEMAAPQDNTKDKLGVALVGLGQYATEELAPALEKTQHCYLAGIVTGTPSKVPRWQREYFIPEKNVYNYDNFDEIKNNPDIDIVYIVLPNALHAEYTIRAAKAGKHVICEKPMAVTVEECDRMIVACEEAEKMLSIGYRLHFEPHNKEMMRLGQEKVFGEIKHLWAENGARDVTGWRLDKELAGGGPLMDMGIYCVQGVCYTSGMEPIAVTAKEGPRTDPQKFSEVEQSLTWQMEMANGAIAHCKTAYDENLNLLRADARNGWFELPKAYRYRGIEGRTSRENMKFPEVNQQALQMDDFALAVKNNRPTPVPGEMGRRDVKILQAIYEAMRTGRRVILT